MLTGKDLYISPLPTVAVNVQQTLGTAMNLPPVTPHGMMS